MNARREAKKLDKNVPVGYLYWQLPRHQALKTCAWFEECPLCYRCRAYDPKYARCGRCEIPRCNTKRHTSDIILKMILRPRVELRA